MKINTAYSNKTVLKNLPITGYNGQILWNAHNALNELATITQEGKNKVKQTRENLISKVENISQSMILDVS